MRTHFKFSHKILFLVSMIVIVAFASLTAYNDARQHEAIRQNLQRYLQEMGGSTANTIVNWLQGRVLLIENLAQAVGGHYPDPGQHHTVAQAAGPGQYLLRHLCRWAGTRRSPRSALLATALFVERVHASLREVSSATEQVN